MCPLAQSAKELILLRGKQQLLCSRRGEHMEYCPHHPVVAGGCGYRRQQALEARNRTRVWIIPTMLAAVPPAASKRPKHGFEGDFDLLVIGESPWFNLLPSKPTTVPIEWFSPEWWAAQDSRATDDQRRYAIETLAKLNAALATFRRKKHVFGRPCNESGRADPPAGPGPRRQGVK
jgi:hypothetical protein